MTNIPKTFCPAKWDELIINLSQNYVYSCCKATPIKIVNKKDATTALDIQKENLLNGIQDPSCEYCWTMEKENAYSRRHRYLEYNSDALKTTINFDDYQHNPLPKKIEISLGNECNFQCNYCNPKFSSQWETDIKNKPYKLFSDRFFYAIDDKNKSGEAVNESILFLQSYNHTKRLCINGGEPLENKHLYKVLDSVKVEELEILTNLSPKSTSSIDKLLSLHTKYKKIFISISIDSTDKNAEFTRYGMNYDKLIKNIKYVLDNASDNIKITFASNMTSITVRDFKKTSQLICGFLDQRPGSLWTCNICVDPKIFSLNTLPNKWKLDIVKEIEKISLRDDVIGLESLKKRIINSEFNNTLYQQLKHFMNEFAERKGIEVPVNFEEDQ